MAIAQEILQGKQTLPKTDLAKEGGLYLTPITPFTASQTKLLETLFIEGIPYENAANSLCLTQKEVDSLLFGNGTFRAEDIDINSFRLYKTHLGLYGITEVLKRRRPQNPDELFDILRGDVILESYDPEVSEFYRLIRIPYIVEAEESKGRKKQRYNFEVSDFYRRINLPSQVEKQLFKEPKKLAKR